jgi:hypothetical protein
MAVVKILHSTSAGAVPASLQSGQIAINELDGVLFWLDATSGNVKAYSLNNPTAPTQPAGNNSTSVATTAFVQSAVASLVNSAPAALNTLKELADAIGDDANFSATINTALGNRLRFDAAQTLTTAQQLQAQTNLGVIGVNSISSTPGDSNYSILATDRVIALKTAFTGPRTHTLPPANSVQPGTVIQIWDFVGAISTTNTLTVQRQGSDTLNAGVSVIFKTPRGRLEFISDGVSSWKSQFIDIAQLPVGTGANQIPILDGNGNLTLANALIVSASATLNSNLTVSGSATVNGGATINGNTAVNGSLTVTRNQTLVAGDVYAYRNAGNTGALFLTSTGSQYLYFDGSNFNLNGASNLILSGSLLATGDVVSAYSDARLKTNLRPVIDALAKVQSLSAVTYEPNDLAVELGAAADRRVRLGLLAHEVEAIAPQVVQPAVFDMASDGSSKSGMHYKTLQYDKLVPMLVAAIQELSGEVES